MRVEGACNLLAMNAMSRSNQKPSFFMSLESSQRFFILLGQRVLVAMRWLITGDASFPPFFSVIPSQFTMDI